jgi:hypothetical protein
VAERQRLARRQRPLARCRQQRRQWHPANQRQPLLALHHQESLQLTPLFLFSGTVFGRRQRVRGQQHHAAAAARVAAGQQHGLDEQKAAQGTRERQGIHVTYYPLRARAACSGTTSAWRMHVVLWGRDVVACGRVRPCMLQCIRVTSLAERLQIQFRIAFHGDAHERTPGKGKW